MLRQVPGGVIGNIYEYEANDKLYYNEQGALDFGRFTRTLKIYDLEGRLLKTNNLINGRQEKPVNARVATTYCVDHIKYNYECVDGSVNDTAAGGYGLNCDGVIYMDIFVSECDGGGSGDWGGNYGNGYYGGGSYIPDDSYYGSGGGYGGGTGGSSGGSGGNSSTYPITISVAAPPLVIVPSAWELKELIENKPFALYGEDIPCALIQQWMALAKFKVSPELKQKVNNIVALSANTPGVLLYGLPSNSAYISKVLDIDNAYSSVVNMDYFSVNVKILPIINGQRATPQQFLNHIRTNINTFVDTKKSKFTAYNHYGVDDHALWNSSNPTGAIVSIDIPLNDGSVIVSKYSPNSWTFSTIKDPYNGLHPVSGNREFGYTANADGSYNFYVMGVDRLTDVWGTIAQSASGFPFDQADALWTSFQDKIVAFVNDPSNGGTPGAAAKNNTDPEPLRPDWVKVINVIDGKQPLSTLSNDCN